MDRLSAVPGVVLMVPVSFSSTSSILFSLSVRRWQGSKYTLGTFTFEHLQFSTSSDYSILTQQERRVIGNLLDEGSSLRIVDSRHKHPQPTPTKHGGGKLGNFVFAEQYLISSPSMYLLKIIFCNFLHCGRLHGVEW